MKHIVVPDSPALRTSFGERDRGLIRRRCISVQRISLATQVVIIGTICPTVTRSAYQYTLTTPRPSYTSRRPIYIPFLSSILYLLIELSHHGTGKEDTRPGGQPFSRD
jgi:hypothetical protein